MEQNLEKNLDEVFMSLKDVLPPDMPDAVKEGMIAAFRFLLAQ